MAERAREPNGDEEATASVRSGLRLHGTLDLLFAALHGWLGFVVAPGRAAWWNILLAAIVGLLAAAGMGLLAGARWGRAVALVAQAALAAFCLVVVALLVASAAYLRGIYGPVGQGMALATLLVAALVVEVSGLLPWFQIRFLSAPEVRRRFASR